MAEVLEAGGAGGSAKKNDHERHWLLAVLGEEPFSVGTKEDEDDDGEIEDRCCQQKLDNVEEEVAGVNTVFCEDVDALDGDTTAVPVVVVIADDHSKGRPSSLPSEPESTSVVCLVSSEAVFRRVVVVAVVLRKLASVTAVNNNTMVTTYGIPHGQGRNGMISSPQVHPVPRYRLTALIRSKFSAYDIAICVWYMVEVVCVCVGLALSLLEG